MDLGLRGKVAIVSGGARGIGEGVVRTLCAEGAAVGIIDRERDLGLDLQDELSAAGYQARFVETDLIDFGSCAAAVATAMDRFGRIDVVVNNAGVNDVVDLTAGPAAFEASLRRNLTHYYALVHHTQQQLRLNRGAIVNVGSKVASTGQGGTSGYAAAKGAINALTREWAVEFAGDGVRVNTVVPAEVWTPMYAQWLATQDDPEDERDRIARRVPLEHRFTDVQEMANMIVFLASTAAGHVTGQMVYVDGGYTHLDRRISSP